MIQKIKEHFLKRAELKKRAIFTALHMSQIGESRRSRGNICKHPAYVMFEITHYKNK